MLSALTLMLFLGLDAQAQQAGPSPATSAALARADQMQIASLVMNEVTRQHVEKTDNGLEWLRVEMEDAQGRMHVELLFQEQVIAANQQQAPGAQTKLLLGIHESFYGALKNALNEPSEEGAGLFGLIEGRPTTYDQIIEDKMFNLSPDGLVVTIGFRQGDKNHAYATVAGKSVTFHPDCPMASARPAGK